MVSCERDLALATDLHLGGRGHDIFEFYVHVVDAVSVCVSYCASHCYGRALSGVEVKSLSAVSPPILG